MVITVLTFLKAKKQNHSEWSKWLKSSLSYIKLAWVYEVIKTCKKVKKKTVNKA